MIIVISVGRNFQIILIRYTKAIQQKIIIIGYAQFAIMISKKCFNGRLMKPNKKSPDRLNEILSGFHYLFTTEQI